MWKIIIKYVNAKLANILNHEEQRDGIKVATCFYKI